METIVADYAPRGVRFYYVYKSLAHPEYNNYITPFTLAERLAHVKEAVRTLDSRVPWLCDTMENEFAEALGGVPNGEIVFDPEGRVAAGRGWSNPDELRKDLERLVGPVARPTRVEELDRKPQPPPPTVARDIVPRVETPLPMTPLRLEPQMEEGAMPFYVKARVEVDPGFLKEGTGKLYVGFHLDPIYRVHWNNKVAPLRFKLGLPAGVSVTPEEALAPQVTEPADADPREFLLDITAEKRDEPLSLDVWYYACDDANTFCVPVKQSYLFHLERDPSAGRTIRRWQPDWDGTLEFFRKRMKRQARPSD